MIVEQTWNPIGFTAFNIALEAFVQVFNIIANMYITSNVSFILVAVVIFIIYLIFVLFIW